MMHELEKMEKEVWAALQQARSHRVFLPGSFFAAGN
jgi:hypothetical protein